MKISILTLFPELVEGALSFSIPSRAAKAGLVEYKSYNLRDWGLDKHGNVDDTPYGGGAGMVLRVDVAHRALEAVDPGHQATRIMLSPDGEQFTQKVASGLCESQKDLVLLCGRYEGFDSRIERYVDTKIAVGQAVVSGGELPALMVIDAVVRLIPGVLGNAESLSIETFNDDLTDYPTFTRPPVYNGDAVPEVLQTGNHTEIEKWRKNNQRHLR